MSTMLAVIAGLTGLGFLFQSRTLASLLGPKSSRLLKYPHTSPNSL
ncbi:MAG: hypothetical protein ACO1RX_17680 [Candidatus Sericytochromatia bacterium]